MLTRVCALLLAGGRGSRFDPSGSRNKLTALLPDGRGVLRTSAQTLREAVERVIVIGPSIHGHLHDALLGLDVRIVANVRASEGMGTSIAQGVRDSADASGWLIALGDMPYLTRATLDVLVAALDAGASIVAPLYKGERGHPVGFAAHHFAALAALQGDSGARALLEKGPITFVEVADSGILRDIDRPGDIV